MHKAINNNQAQQCFGKWKTNENSFKEKPLQYPIACIENSLEEPITIVYLQNIYTTSLPLNELLKWAVCGLNYQAQFILINQIQAVLRNRVQLGL